MLSITGFLQHSPEGSDAPLYVLYEVLSQTPISAVQEPHPTAERLAAWLQPYTAFAFSILATLSDGEKAILAALKARWPSIPHQRCQLHFLNTLAKPAMELDTRLRQQLRTELGDVAAVSTVESPGVLDGSSPPFAPPQRDADVIALEQQVRHAIRDAVNRTSRKPFAWGHRRV